VRGDLASRSSVLRVLGLLGALGSLITPQAARADEPPPVDPAALKAPTKDSGPLRYTLEDVEIHSNGRTGPRVILHHVRFRPGDVLDVADPEIELTRYRLLSTGFFSSVALSLRRGSRRGAAVLVIDVVERNTLLVQNLWFGVAADEDTAGHAKPLSGFLGLEVAETNLLGTGVELGAGIAVASQQIALRAHVVDPVFAGTSWSALFSLVYADARDFFGNRAVVYESPQLGSGQPAQPTDYAVVAYQRYGGTLGTGHALGLFSQLALEYHLEQVRAEVPTSASHLRGNTREPIDFSILPGKSWLSTLRASLSYDTRDLPFLTRRGVLASAAATAGVPPLGSSYGYVRVELSAQRWWELPWKHVIHASAFVGGIAGNAPFFEQFYIGDFTDLIPDRVLDLTPDRRQPPNLLGTDVVEVRFGAYAAKVDLEYRVPIFTGKRAIYGIDLFASTGLWGVAGLRDITDPPGGYTGLRKLPVDLTYNVGVRLDTALGGATIALSNLLGLIPAGSTVQH
jgi:outer membrane protein insertion porin family